MNELLPCPFCGGEASVKVLEYGDDCKVWGVFCESDLAGEYSHGHFVDNYATEAEAVAAWNTRANAEYGAVPATDENMAKHGWVRERTCHDGNIGGSFVCSECGANVKDTYVGRSYVDEFGKRWYATSSGQAFNYCPNCGARVVE